MRRAPEPFARVLTTCGSASPVRCLPRSLLRALIGFCVAIAALPQATAGPPGSLRESAAGDGHLWWSVRRIAPEVPGAARAGTAPEFLLMHHASVEPAPTERFVMTLRGSPEALAAEGNRLVIVMPAEGERRRLVLALGTERNDAIGHWYSVPRGAPRVLESLDAGLRILSATMVDGSVCLLATERLESGEPRVRLMRLAADVGATWTSEEPPPFDRAESAEREASLLFRDGKTLCAAGFVAGAPAIARLEGGAWNVERIALEGPSDWFGAFSIGGRIVAVERLAPGAQEGSPRIRLSSLRQGTLIEWARFAEPKGLWTVAAFGSDALLLEIDDAGRGVVRTIAPSSNAPGEAVALMPPGFASANWVHIPLISMAAVALALAAMIFGSEAYLASRLGKAPKAPRAMGAPVSRRLAAFVIDAAPAFVVAWFIFGGSPLRFMAIPILTQNVADLMPAASVLVGGWLVASIGDGFFGRSLGKRVLGLVIVGRDGKPARPGPRFLRSLLSIIALFAPPVMLIALAHPSGDGPAEMLSGTAVVDEAESRAISAGKPADSDPG